jgi:histidine triad (HIT) family protein
MIDCIFCKIVAGRSPSQMLYQDDHVSAFRDIRPVAPTHVLVIPNKHIPSVNDISPDDENLLGHLFTVAKEIARLEGVDQTGYRLIINNGRHAGQIVFHLHLHVIGGQRMRHPMG